MIKPSLLCLGLILATSLLSGDEEAFRPTPGEFPPIEKAKSYRGELVFVDHINRRGSLRLHVDGHFHEGKLHHFAMLPYGRIYYRGAPAELRDIPIGTVLYGRFFLPPDPKTSAVPLSRGTDVTQPAENHAILLEDGLSLNLREGKAWKLENAEWNTSGSGTLTVSRERADNGEGLGGKHEVTIDASTRIWRGRELLGIDDLIDEGTWLENAQTKDGAQSVQVGLTWHPRYLYQQFHVADLWLDEAATEVARERQRQRHIRYIRTRWMPARVDSVTYGKFGEGSVTVTLFAGMDDSLYDDFKTGSSGQMAAAENTLRTYWPDHDGMDGKITAVERTPGETASGNSGIQVTLEMNLVLEGFRPGRIVRIRPASWPKVKPPIEERIRGLHSRWPGHEIFTR
jgi:hypothetical protein